MIDPKNDTVVATIDAGGALEYLVAGGNGKLYVNGEPKPTALSGRTMAIDPQTGRLYIAAADLDAAPAPPGQRPRVVPGSLKLLFWDPAP